MAFTYDLTTDLGKVRLLLNDVDQDMMVFKDEEISAFLALEGGSVKRAAAQAIDVNASNEALASKVIRDHALSTDGARLADAMRKHATALRDQADNYDDPGVFTVVDFDAQCVVPELTEPAQPAWGFW